jgi:LysM repeat protein
MQGHQKLALFVAVALIAGCRTERPMSAPEPLPSQETNVQGIPVGDDRTAMEAAIDVGPGSSAQLQANADTATPREGLAINPNAPESYTVKRGDTLWGIAKVFLRDPWYWPEIWQVNPQVKNPHLIYPGDTLRLVYIDGHPKLLVQRGESALQRGNEAKVVPRVRSQPLDNAVTTIPYETVAAFMSKPSVLAAEQIKLAPYVLATRDLHVVMSDGDTLYARGFRDPVELGTHYNVIRVGDPLRDPDDNRILGYDGIFTGAGHVTRLGDPVTLIMTESTRETEAGDKLIAGGVDVPLDFVPSAPKVKVNGRIISVANGVTVIGQYEVVVINRGARDGIVPGNVLGVFDTGPTVEDTDQHGFLNSGSKWYAKKVPLPSERTGTFLVFKTFDNLSYGLIMEATNLIRVADKVENP